MIKITSRTYILFIALVIVVVFATSLKNDFVWDDAYLIINNPHIKSSDFIAHFFIDHLYSGSEGRSDFYRPFQLLSFTIDYWIWKLNSFGYHLTSLLLHIANSSLVYAIIINISASSYVAFFTALLFGIAPVISSITYYIAARSDLLMALFLFLSILLFIKYVEKNKKILYIASLLTFIFSLLSKEMAVILPFLLALEILSVYKRCRISLRILWPYIFILAIYFGLRMSILNFAEGPNKIIYLSFPATISIWNRLFTDFKVILLYLRVLLFPFGLHMDWFVTPAKTVFRADILLSIFVFILLLLGIIKLHRRNKLILFGALWFLLCLIPVLNIYPISVFFGEGWLYVPAVGFFIVFTVIFKDILIPKIGIVSANILFILFLTYYAFFTFAYGKTWKDSIAVLQNIIKYEQKSPFIYLTYNNLAIAYYNKGEFEKSIYYCQKSISCSPDYAAPYNNMAIAYMALKKPIKAIKFFKKSIRVKRDYMEPYANIGAAYSFLGLKDRVIQFANIAIKIKPDFYKAYCNLGYMHSQRGEIDEAMRFFKKASYIRDEYPTVHYCIGNLYAKKNNYKEAIYEYNKAIKLGLDNFEIYNDIAFAYLKERKYREAEVCLYRSLLLNNNQFGPHNNLGNLYAMFGYFDLAIVEYKKALAIDPNNKGIMKNLTRAKVGKRIIKQKNANKSKNR